MQSLYSNTTGNFNTALGYFAGYTANPANANTTGSNNTFIGYGAGPGVAAQLTNATAIGNGALVSASNSLVLGDAVTNVGIGTSTPAYLLHVVSATPYTMISNENTAVGGATGFGTLPRQPPRWVQMQCVLEQVEYVK